MVLLNEQNFDHFLSQIYPLISLEIGLAYFITFITKTAVENEVGCYTSEFLIYS